VSVLSVGLSVYRLVTNVYFAKMAESIEMLFRVVGRLGLRYDVVNREPTSPREGRFLWDGWRSVMEERAMQPFPKLFDISC